MRILITNDDGINAPGLEVMEQIARDIAGTDGEVWIVAPAFEQSGVGHCISYAHPFLIAQQGEKRFAAEGSPADCVLAGLYDVMKDTPPDLVLSGVNRGNNSAENAAYSGTLGAAMEAALQGIPAIALSQFYGPHNVNTDQPFEAALTHGAGVIRHLLDADLWDDGYGYRMFYNVNFPPCTANMVKGTTLTTQGRRPGTNFTTEPQLSPSGRRFLWIKGGNQQVSTAPGSDAAANLDFQISVTPMSADLTVHSALSKLAGTFE